MYTITEYKMAETIVDGTLFNTDCIKYGAPKANASGVGKSINIMNKNTKSALRISTPLMLTWGASDFENNKKFEMSLQFPNDEYKTDDCTDFLNNMVAFEEKIKADAMANSKEWFGKVIKSADVINALYSPMLKYRKDKVTGEPDLNSAPLLRVKIQQWDNQWKCLICDEDNKKLFPNTQDLTVSPLDFINKGTHLAIIMQSGGIWYANGKFGVTWKLNQAVVQRPKASVFDECLIKLKPSDRQRLQEATPAETEDRAETEIPTTVESSDDEVEEEEEEDQVEEEEDPVEEEEEEEEEVIPEPEPEPEPVKPKKKVVRKKTTA